MPKISFRLIGTFLGVFLFGGIAGFLIFWQGAKHGMLWATPDVGWAIIQDAAHDKWDQAIKLALARIRDERRDYGLYNQMAIVYLERAQEDTAHRDQWVRTATSYLDRAASLGPNDMANLLQVTQGYERAGDLVRDGCVYYKKALAEGQKGLTVIPKDFVQVDNRRFPTQPVRTEFDDIIYRLQTKVRSCQSTGSTTAPNP